MPLEMSGNTELRMLPANIILDLVKILEPNDHWKVLMFAIPKDGSNLDADIPKYTTEDMCLIDEAGRKQMRSCTEILFEEWGTSGKNRPNIRLLLQCLVKAELYRAADYVARNILKESLPERPKYGPAAKIPVTEIFNENALVTESNSDSFSAEYSRLTESEEMSDSEYPIQLENTKLFERYSTAPDSESAKKHACDYSTDLCDKFSASLSTVIDQRSKSTDFIQSLPFEFLKKVTNNFDESRKKGSGAFGSVYRGCVDGKDVAVKVLGSGEVGKMMFQQFETELTTLIRCQHANILPLLAISKDSTPCLVYEYMPNGSLLDGLASVDRMPLSCLDRLRISKEIADGLEYLHTSFDKPIIHRDIKSANILLDVNNVAKIGDFGLVKIIQSTTKTNVQTSTVTGTSAYMSPEAHRGDISPKMDVFSFGVVLLELLTGLPPYDEDREGCDLITHLEDLEDDMEQSIRNLLDGRAGRWIPEIANKLNELARKCLQEKRVRPYIRYVSNELSSLYEVHSAQT